MEEDTEVVEIDSDTEDLAYALTLLVKEISPKIDCGGTYEVIVRLLIQFLDAPVHDLEIKDYAKRILATSRQNNSKH